MIYYILPKIHKTNNYNYYIHVKANEMFTMTNLYYKIEKHDSSNTASTKIFGNQLFKNHTIIMYLNQIIHETQGTHLISYTGVKLSSCQTKARK